MSVMVKLLKRALRFLSIDQAPCAILELNALIQENDGPQAAYFLRGKARERMKRYPEAIADYMQALAGPEKLSRGHTLSALESIVVCISSLDQSQQATLSEIMKQFKLYRAGDVLQFRRTLVETYVSPAMEAVAPNPFKQPIQVATANSFNQPPTGRIANIGKFLLDSNDIAKLQSLVNNAPDSGIKMLTTFSQTIESKKPDIDVASAVTPAFYRDSSFSQQDVDHLHELATKIDSHKKVIGTCIFKITAMPIISTFPEDIDPEWYGIHSIGIYLTAVKTSELLGYSKVQQIVMRTSSGYVIVVYLGNAYLVTITETMARTTLTKLVRNILKLVANKK